VDCVSWEAKICSGQENHCAAVERDYGSGIFKINREFHLRDNLNLLVVKVHARGADD